MWIARNRNAPLVQCAFCEHASRLICDSSCIRTLVRILRLESGILEETRKALIAPGWPIGPSDGGFGRYECIEPHMDGNDRVYSAASEMRADGCALAY
jgi:hypothetical protein